MPADGAKSAAAINRSEFGTAFKDRIASRPATCTEMQLPLTKMEEPTEPAEGWKLELPANERCLEAGTRIEVAMADEVERVLRSTIGVSEVWRHPLFNRIHIGCNVTKLGKLAAMLRLPEGAGLYLKVTRD